MQKRLLVLAAGILQVPVIERARAMGIYVIAADGCQDAVGLKYADKGVVVDITSEEDVLRVAQKEHIDGVIHPCSEVSMNVMGRLNDELHLPGITRQQAIRATNKYLMREAFQQGNAPSPKCFLAKDADDAWQHLQTDFEVAAVLKPSRNSGSRGVAKVWPTMERADFVRAYEVALAESRDASVVIEQYVDGPEFSIEAIVHNGKPMVLAVTDKLTTGAPHFVELGHSQPSCHTPAEVEELKAATIAGIKALGVDNCACHAEAKLMNGKAWLMEIGARLGGDFIATELTHLSTGIDMVGAAISLALGMEPDLSVSEVPKGACIRYFCPKPGRLQSIANTEIFNDARVYQWEIYNKPGDVIPELTSSLCRSGHVIVTGPTPQEAIALAEQIVHDVKIVTE